MDNLKEVISVSRSVSEKIAADYVTLSLTAIGEGKYADAVDKSEAIGAAAVVALKNAGVKDVRTQGINVSAVRDGKKISAYRAVKSYTAGFGFDKAMFGKVLDALSGTDCEWRVSFSLKDRESASKALVARAVKEARERAEVIAEAAGVSLGGLCGVEYNSSDYDGGRPVVMRASLDGYENADPVDVTLSETVTCRFEIV